VSRWQPGSISLECRLNSSKPSEIASWQSQNMAQNIVKMASNMLASNTFCQEATFEYSKLLTHTQYQADEKLRMKLAQIFRLWSLDIFYEAVDQEKGDPPSSRADRAGDMEKI